MFSDWVNKWLAQISHVGWGAYLTMAISQHTTLGHAALWVLAGATIKEGIFDPLTETKALQGSGFQDWSFWCLGIVLGIASFWK